MKRLAARVLAALVAASFPLAASAASGLAWDSVTKISMGGDSATLQPGDFDSDFAAAAAAQPPQQQSGGGIFNQIHQAMGMGAQLQQMMQTGIAQRHYLAGSKERTDDVARQTATIVDCAARTITTLDLQRKTYSVVSMDRPQTGGPAGAPASPAAQRDDGTKVAVAVSNAALGALQVGGQSTDGYRSQIAITETSASGESRTQNGELLAYYSALPTPAAGCAPQHSMAGPAGAMMGGYSRIMRALSSGGTDPRFSVKQSGPALPLGRMAMYDALTLGAQGRGATIVTERGNVRTIGPDDPAFAIPPGFTQVSASP